MQAIHRTLTNMGGMDDVLFYLNKAIEIYTELKQNHRETRLLHGDMHHENLLLNANGGYTIIDPKGIADMPVMETARFLMNETPCEVSRIKEIVSIISGITKFSEQDIFKCMFIDAALSKSWSMEEHYATQAEFEEEREEVHKVCGFVYGLL